jgi:hypothetical protein
MGSNHPFRPTCIARALPVLTLALAACSASPRTDIAEAQHRYLAAKTTCVSEYPRSLALQSECRTRAANTYIRPYYRYGDLMTYVQDRRQELAAQTDRHEISRGEYQQEVAQAEAEVAREEDRRNRKDHVASSYDNTPINTVVAKISRIFQ